MYSIFAICNHAFSSRFFGFKPVNIYFCIFFPIRMKIIISLLFLSTITSVLAYNWYNGGAGITYGLDCDFRWGDIGKYPSTAEQCGPMCMNQFSQCTHFTWWNGYCWIKRFNSNAAAKGLPGGVCGWVVRNG